MVSAALRAAPEASVRVERVLVPVVVTDQAGAPVPDLKPADFQLEVDGRATRIDSFEAGEAPVAVAILIDTSASMVGTRLRAARRAARRLAERLTPRDRAMLIGFDHRAQVQTPLTPFREEILRGLDSLPSGGGGTALYDAFALAIESLQDEPGRKAVVLLTDGEDTRSRVSRHALERAARRSQVVLYPLWVQGLVDPAIGPDPGLSGDAARLQDLAADLGGLARLVSSDRLEAAYGEILAEMRAQYTLTFAPALPPDGRWHRIRVRTDESRYRVRARKGWLHE